MTVDSDASARERTVTLEKKDLLVSDEWLRDKAALAGDLDTEAGTLPASLRCGAVTTTLGESFECPLAIGHAGPHEASTADVIAKFGKLYPTTP
jgi:hypothetical protein